MQEEHTSSFPCLPPGLKKQGETRVPSGNSVTTVSRAWQRGKKTLLPPA